MSVPCVPCDLDRLRVIGVILLLFCIHFRWWWWFVFPSFFLVLENQSRRTFQTVLCLLLLLLRSPAISLGFTILGEIFAYVTVF